MGFATAVAVGGALIGGIAGAQGQKGSSSSNSSSGVSLGAEGDNEKAADQSIGSSFNSLQNMVNAGPGQSDVTNATNQQRNYASMLGDYSKSGGAASQQDIQQAQSQAALQFAPQQVALDQSFQQEQMRAKQLAAQLGRPVNDPYIQAQLGKERMNNMQMLAANQGAFVGQQSQQNAMNRLGFAGQLTDVQNSLASQAMSNRQALLSMGQSIQSNDRNFRLASGTRWGNQQTDSTSGGGIAGGISGAIGGASMGMGAMKLFGSGTTPQPSQEQSAQAASDDVGRMGGLGANISQYSIGAQPASMAGTTGGSQLGWMGGYGNNVSAFGGMSSVYNSMQSSGNNLYNSAGTGLFNKPGY